MKRYRGLAIHLTLFAVAAAAGLCTLFRPDDGPEKGRPVAVELWGGSPSDLRQIRFESNDLKVWLAPKSDAAGRYYVVDTERPAKTEPEPDAGVSTERPAINKRFLSVDEGEALATSLVPMKIYRSLGRVEGARLADFGFDKPEGTVVVSVGGKEHRIVVGSLTPGSDDYYIRDEPTGQVYTFSAEQLNRLKFGDNRLMERDFHGFKLDDVVSVRVATSGKSRNLTRLLGKSEAWADTATPASQDETATNFLSKVARLRPQAYLEKVDGISAPLFSVDYQDAKGQKLGQVEVFRSGEDAQKKYFARTERSRWYAEVARPSAEQLEQDVATVAK